MKRELLQKLYKGFVYIICFVFILGTTACLEAGGGSSGIMDSLLGNGSTGGLQPTGSSATEIDNGEQSSDGNVGPVATLPLPPMLKDTLAFNHDEYTTVPVTGAAVQADGSPLPEGYQVALSVDSISISSVTPASFEIPLVQKAFAYSFGVAEPAHAVDPLKLSCDDDSVVCCPLDSDGKFECYLPLVDSSSEDITISIVDPSQNVAVEKSEPIQPNLKWLAAAPTDLTTAGDDVVAIVSTESGAGLAIELKDNDDALLTVQGIHTDTAGAYRAFDAAGTQVAWDGIAGRFGFLDVIKGVKSTDGVGAVVGLREIDDAKAYSVLKSVTSDKLPYFGIEQKANNEIGHVFYYEKDTSYLISRATVTNDDIQFLGTGDFDLNGKKILHGRTNAFDVNDNGYALVAFDDTDGKTWLRIGNGPNRFGIGVSLNSYVLSSEIEVVDVGFVDETMAVVIDMYNDQVYLVEINYGSKKIESYLGRSFGIRVGSKPIGLVFNNDRSRGYVLNQGDDSITVLNFKNSDGSLRSRPGIVATVNLSDFVLKKISAASIKFNPVGIELRGDDLIIASDTLKSLVSLNVSSIEEIALADEESIWYRDADGDGYGDIRNRLVQTSQPEGYVDQSGDCNDRVSNIYPNATELCDGKDNNCNGEVDENIESQTWYRDADEDGFGFEDSTVESCSQPSGYLNTFGDCNDDSPTSYPGATEVADDGIDNDCDGTVDEISM